MKLFNALVDLVADLDQREEKSNSKLGSLRSELKRCERKIFSMDKEHAAVVQSLIDERERAMEKHQQDVTKLTSRLRTLEEDTKGLKEANRELDRDLAKIRAKNLKLRKSVSIQIVLVSKVCSGSPFDSAREI